MPLIIYWQSTASQSRVLGQGDVIIYEVDSLQINHDCYLIVSFVGKKTPVEMWRTVKGPMIYVVRKKFYNFFL